MVGQPLSAPGDSEEEFSEEEEHPSVVHRTRELFWGPKSWLFAFCLLGPLVAFCPCDGRHVWKSEEEEVSADDAFDQRGGILLRTVSSSRLEASEKRGALPSRQNSLGAAVEPGQPALLFPSAAKPLPYASEGDEG